MDLAGRSDDNGQISRPELLSDLMSALELHRCTVLVAPTGFAKTTMALSVARSTDRRVIWVTASEFDRDPAHLIGSLVAAGATSERPANGPGQSCTLADIKRALYLPPCSTLVIIDDAHLLVPETRSESASTALLSHAISCAPSYVSFLICTRRPLRDLAEIFGKQSRTLDSQALRFSDREVDLLARRLGIAPADRHRAVRSMAQYDGWPIAVSLALRQWIVCNKSTSPGPHLDELVHAAVIEMCDADRTLLRRLADLRTVRREICEGPLCMSGIGDSLKRLSDLYTFVDWSESEELRFRNCIAPH
jgi:ATP/maltotriose-dependent transcriptional regulator MalT